MSRAVLALLAVVLVMSGCSGAGHPATVTTSTLSTTTTTIVPADAAQLMAIVIQTSDLPALWTETDPGDSETGGTDNGIVDSNMAQCVGVADLGDDEVASADSATFSLGVDKIGSTATSYMSAADVLAADADFSKPTFGSCVQNQFIDGISSGTVVRDPVTTVTLGPSAGPSNVVATVSITLTVVSSGVSVKGTVRVVIMTGPLVLSEAYFLSFAAATTPISASLEGAVVAKVAARTAAAT